MPQREVQQPAPAAQPACRFCGGTHLHAVLDLGMSPLANAYRSEAQLLQPETFYPLRAVLCESCFLMQLTSSPPPTELFQDYRYFSSFSATMSQHARAYAEMAASRFGLSPQSLVVEIASNDGYLLRYFKERSIPVLGIEPARTVAEAAMHHHGIPTLTRFFGLALAQELKAKGQRADLVVANNVLAHVPDPNDFVAGIACLLSERGVVTVEFPDVASLLDEGQFDTIYHEHCSYLSLQSAERMFRRHGLTVFDVDKIGVHGGSLRLYACRDGTQAVSLRVASLRDPALEHAAAYEALAQKAHAIKRDLLGFLIEAKRQSKRLCAYGAPAKGNTLLNFCGIRTDFLDFTVDISPHKQGLYLPGSGIPILAPEALKKEKPDYVLILPWNLKNEIMHEHAYIRDWDGHFVLAIPQLEIC
ncbi:MAG: class I SAM-dependent methyltransferase [Alphaproteobacteria bacterium]|nr:class I SAM-dependent methyltransferase [Alphaproteobacteria bacterium]